jgi:phenylalanine-4-hydroxylase
MDLQLREPEHRKNKEGEARFLVELDADHPGFRDEDYRARRDAIALAARSHQPGAAPPVVAYTDDEHATWALIRERLCALNGSLAASRMLELDRRLGLPNDRIPQLAEVSLLTDAATGFRLEPVAGLATPRAFLERLGSATFLCTQYIRHHERPFYTPEPDVVHELLGHGASLLDPGFTKLFRRWGRAVASASEEELGRLGRVFWHAVEFGGVEEQGSVKAVGAGLLSSCGELESFRDRAQLKDWDLETMSALGYDPTDYQPQIFVAPGFDELVSSLGEWLAAGTWRD